MATDPSKPWYAAGLRFECTACGKCCWAHDGYAHVFVNSSDARALAEHLGMTMQRFEERHAVVDRDGSRELLFEDGHCTFLKEGKCSVYEARPTQCRTWPFWPETLVRRVWEKEVAPFCPGVGKGKRHSRASIERAARATRKAEVDPRAT